MERSFSIGPSPHLWCGQTTSRIAWGQLAALLPVWFAGLVLFPLDGLRILALGICSVVFFEWIFAAALRKSPQLTNGRLFLNAVLFVSIIPIDSPWWIVIIGCFLFFMIGEKIFGGSGQNIFQPVFVAIAILTAAFPATMEFNLKNILSLNDFFLASSPQNIAGASAAAVIIGAAIVFSRRMFYWEAPLVFILCSSVVLWGAENHFGWSVFPHMFFFIALFSLSDLETSPISRKGQLIYGAIAGLLFCGLLSRANFLLTVSGAILLSNACVPLIDYICRPEGARQ